MSTDIDPSVPGRLLLRMVRMVFSDHALATIVEPAIADFQREAAGASAGGAHRRVRGYGALWTLFLLAAFVPGAGAGAPLLLAVLGLNGGFLVAFLTPVLFVALWPTLGVFSAAAPLAGLAFAFVVRAWNERHPVVLACTRRTTSRDPEINLSGIPVRGDAGGFLFVVASVVTMLGLPELRSFVVGALLVGTTLACALFVWRRSHVAPLRRVLTSQ